MKTFKKILLTILRYFTVPLTFLTSFGLTWFLLPLAKDTVIGKGILKVFSNTAIFWITLSSAILLTTFIILNIIFNKSPKAKTKNLVIHTNTWVAGLVGIFMALSTFILTNPIIAEGISITIPKKIAIGIDVVLLVIFHVFSEKLNRIINRRIQAYETAKEMNVVGRSSIIWVNILKLVEILFPEILILGLLCLMLSWDVSSYFTVLLISFVIPIIGNIICDFNTRTEIIDKKEKEHKRLVDDVANSIKGENK